jgi:hypothetical protein
VTLSSRASGRTVEQLEAERCRTVKARAPGATCPLAPKTVTFRKST